MDAQSPMNNDETIKALSLGNFSKATLSHYPEFIDSILTVKKACALANYKTNLLSKKELESILTSCENKFLEKDFAIDPFIGGGGIAVHQNINEYLSKYSSLSKEKINLSQSTSDVGHTAFRIATKKIIKKNKKNIQQINSLYSNICENWKENKTIARTCLRDAGETTFGNFFSGHYELFKRRTGSIEKSIENLQINLGGTVFGSGIGATKEYQKIVIQELQAQCDLPLTLSSNLYDSAQNSDDLAEASNQLALFSKATLKIFQDIRLLFSGPEHGFNAIHLKPLMAGSSFFKIKSNPILPETLIQAAILILGKDHALQLGLEQSELDLNVYDFLMGFLLLDQLEIFGKMLPLWEQTLNSMEIYAKP